MKKIIICALFVSLLCCSCSENKQFEEKKSALPTVYIEAGDIGTKSIEGTMKIIDPIDNTPEEQLYDGEIEIKLRGNSTAYRDKHPYKVKLNEKTDIFGMGENKHWVLLANDLDHTQIRNQITLDFARAIGMDNTSESKLVSLVLNGEYQGVYELAEHVRVGKTRVDIYDWEDTFADEVDDEIKPRTAKEISADTPQTGGFLLEGDSRTYEDYFIDGEYDENLLKDKDKMTNNIFTDWYMPLSFNTPEGVYPDTELYKYAYNYIQSFEYALHSSDFTYHAKDKHYMPTNMKVNVDENGAHWTYDLKESDYHDEQFDGYKYTDFFDLDSLVNYFILNEITMNYDAMRNSIYLYKDIEGKAYMGPAWDYDIAFNNTGFNNNAYITDTWKNLDDRFFTEGENFFFQSTQWYVELCKNEEFLEAVYDKYQAIRNTAIQDMLDSVYEYEKLLDYDCKMNDNKWGYRYSNRYDDPNADIDNSFSEYSGVGYKEAYKFLEQFLTERVSWLDEQLLSKDTFYKSISNYLD